MAEAAVKAPPLKAYPVIPILAPGAMAASKPYSASDKMNEALGFPGKLPEDWKARALDKMVLDSDLAIGRVYPSLKRIREISAVLGAAVADIAFADGLARVPRPVNTLEYVKSKMWEPKYEAYLK